MLDRTYYRALSTAELAERGMHNGGELEVAMAERLDDLLDVERRFMELQTERDDAIRERDNALVELNELKNKNHNH